ncbi:entericidin A/B family lipoprotein [Ruegeria sp. Ofav3-42]|nr:entericidin A/B family lipoprotein [Ruegeria sp. Ofav3-42]MCG7518815.1 entericidin A/B family lipoprotein [Ruegeria sp. Ofav3-42]
MIRAILVGLALFSLAACETAKGAGKDIENAGDAIQEAATDVQQNI